MKENSEIRIASEYRGYDSYFKVDIARIEEIDGGKVSSTYDRFKLTRPDAVGILVYNEDSKKVILVKQFRYPIIHHTKENVLEIVAGKIDSGETPKQSAVRELFEEIGYKITEERLGNAMEIFASPGYSTEKIYIFLAVVKNSDKEYGCGGGLESEHENIEIVEMDIQEFVKKIKTNEIKDSKTIISSNLINI